MSLRDLVEPDCAGANSLMRLGNQIRRDVAFKDEGLGPGTSASFLNRSQHYGSDQLVNEFLGQIAPPQTFRMDSLLQEMREIDAHSFPNRIIRAPPVIEEVNSGIDWANEFSSSNVPHLSDQNSFGNNKMLNDIWNQNTPPPYDMVMAQTFTDKTWTKEFFDVNESLQRMNVHDTTLGTTDVPLGVPEDSDQFKYSEFMKFMQNVGDGEMGLENGAVGGTSEDWVKDFDAQKKTEAEMTENYNTQFWNKLQDEWKKMSNEEGHPWLSEFTDYYDPYKEYTFDEENPMTDLENAFEKGKYFLSHGDIPSAVLCFESAVKQEPNNAEIWELLGTCQAENEKDPNAIAALKRSLDLNPNNPNVMMSLAVSFTNESLQNQALNMLVNWLKTNENYRHLVPPLMTSADDEMLTSSIIKGPNLKEVQQLFLTAVQQKHPQIDPDIQEALGVLFNLSSEYDKAVDCFQAALHVRPNAKTWNRLGASYANGNRSVEAVDAYQRALEIQPGFIRARYNVGIICINLKAYKEAAEHFLTALNLQSESLTRSGLHQAKPSNQMSETIWSTLRMAISLSGRMDLQPAIDERNLTALNSAFNLNS
ncbi:Peroxisomal targeting signal 1 receptor [Pseudolycoriella hygida]|uniref:Peroxisomal targeting signal 1 receptor n=1 Tax=Pseudolycoriella hygida TaxID=35572 RepID=A0A9Q0MRJ7_9DIPT|nr:Peroxisomal targeting signal 1 receptor [Pseudolycoriella hygida]